MKSARSHRIGIRAKRSSRHRVISDDGSSSCQVINVGGGSQFDSSNYSEMAGIELESNSSDEIQDDQKENPHMFYESAQVR